MWDLRDATKISREMCGKGLLCELRNFTLVVTIIAEEVYHLRMIGNPRVRRATPFYMGCLGPLALPTWHSACNMWDIPLRRN